MSYKENTLKIPVVYGFLLREMFLNLFLSIVQAYDSTLEINKEKISNIDKGFNADLDLSGALNLYSARIFNSKEIDAFTSREIKFSLKNMRGIIDKTLYENHKHKDLILVKKKINDSYSINKIDHICNIAETMKKLRNKSSHQENIADSAEALVFTANLCHLLMIYPTELRKHITGIDDFETYIRDDLLMSVLEVYKPTIVQEENLPQVDYEHSESDIERDISVLSYENQEIISKVSRLDLQIGQMSSSIGVLLNYFSSKENQITDHDEDDEDYYLSEDTKNNILSEIDWHENQEDEEDQTLAQLKDDLNSLKQQVSKHMKREYSSFQNWHHILQTKIFDEILVELPKDIDQFKSLPSFIHYYESKQMVGRLAQFKDIEDRKADAKRFMDEQLALFWDDLSEIIHKFSKEKD